MFVFFVFLPEIFQNGFLRCSGFFDGFLFCFVGRIYLFF